MSIFSAVFGRSNGTWAGGEVDLSEAESIDDITDLMRDVAGAEDPDAAEGTMVLLMEADDEWFGVVRVDDRADPRVFLSDARAVHSNAVAALLLDSGTIHEPEMVEGTGQKPYPDPGGDTGLLADLGTAPADLIALTLGEGLLPADALAVLAERAGFADSLDALRV
ncbi:putative tRNA adenosine deaminase-associated protein [Murinocardiopsis flavida]|uniref:Putative tRNA adenosine deaminase-associated protein n=1 Tax=Murinocardiopsis flavida TaxID=645275 RepID=A0A2P8DE10_9ACTN|nr:tRNA adenosine deaminase-associated protein [Murinocardiopsis flavida]PSK95468.1 putative tRNA adenosine deaminase-associated protein [Murinocardiopsis flavida]